jgi:hypothetical protein
VPPERAITTSDRPPEMTRPKDEPPPTVARGSAAAKAPFAPWWAYVVGTAILVLLIWLMRYLRLRGG